MTVLVIAPTRPELPDVAAEAAEVINMLGGRLLQGQITERDVRTAAAVGAFDGIWFATHTDNDRVLLSGQEYLGIDALIAYVAASGASWCFLNTCQSINLGQRLVDETDADVICTIAPAPDGDAMRTGVLFANQLRLLGTPRAAYERSKPGGNRLYVYLGNFPQREPMPPNTAGMPSAASVSQDRLFTTMENIQNDVSAVKTDVAVMKRDVKDLDARLSRIELQLKPTTTWQTWLILMIGLGICALIVLVLTRP